MPQFERAILPNGLHVIAEHNESARSVSAGFFVKTGSRDETPNLAGVSHFLEHMAFKGSETRDALAVNRDFDRVGAKHNAQTSEEDTVYHVTCLPEYLAPAFDVLADLIRPSLRESDFETEKQVIIEEIKMYQDNPMSVAYEAVKALHYGAHPLGGSVLGSVGSIERLKVEEMRAYFESRYGPANIVLAFTGKTDWPRILELAQRRCGGWSGPEAGRSAAAPRGSCGFQAIARPEDHQETVVAIADGPALESDDRYAALLLATAVGDHTGSRLYWELVDPGKADAAEMSYQDFNQAGAFYTFLSCEPESVSENLARIAALYRRVQDEGVTAAELERVKNKVLARLVLRGERPMGRLMSLGFHWSYKREYLPTDEEIERFRNVSIADLKRVLADWPLDRMTITAIGPNDRVEAPAV